MIGSWNAAVKNNFAENKLPRNAEYNLENAHDPWLNTLKLKRSYNLNAFWTNLYNSSLWSNLQEIIEFIKFIYTIFFIFLLLLPGILI